MIDVDYPIDYSLYSVEEIAFLIHFFHRVEASKHHNINHENLKNEYKQYRTIISNISEEKRIDKAIEKQTGVSIYRLIQSIS